jgi:DNA-directed RNA polymerase subunit RPC12/RpoP
MDNVKKKTGYEYEVRGPALEKDEERIAWGWTTEGKVFLTSKKLVIANKCDQHNIMKLEDIRKVYGFSALKKDRIEIMIYTDAETYSSFVPRVELSVGDKLAILGYVFDAGYTRLPPSQGRLANNWISKIQNAVRDRQIALLQKDTIEAWKCKYCETLNDAEKESCSHCGSPRRSQELRQHEAAVTNREVDSHAKEKHVRCPDCHEEILQKNPVVCPYCENKILISNKETRVVYHKWKK